MKDPVITEDYEMVVNWKPRFLCVTFSNGDREDVELAVSNYLDPVRSQADVDKYKRLKEKLGL